MEDLSRPFSSDFFPLLSPPPSSSPAPVRVGQFAGGQPQLPFRHSPSLLHFRDAISPPSSPICHFHSRAPYLSAAASSILHPRAPSSLHPPVRHHHFHSCAPPPLLHPTALLSFRPPHFSTCLHPPLTSLPHRLPPSPSSPTSAPPLITTLYSGRRLPSLPPPAAAPDPHRRSSIRATNATSPPTSSPSPPSTSAPPTLLLAAPPNRLCSLHQAPGRRSHRHDTDGDLSGCFPFSTATDANLGDWDPVSFHIADPSSSAGKHLHRHPLHCFPFTSVHPKSFFLSLLAVLLNYC